MADSFIIEIDWPEFLASNSQCVERKWTQELLEDWLEQNGFERCEGNWLCEEISLSLLHPAEFRIVRRVV